MKLSESKTGDVVKNSANSNFYRYEAPAEDRARIRPLELFPNGLLIAKPTDTIVAADIDVEYIGTWSDGLQVSGVKGRKRELYEAERQQLILQLQVLEAEALVIEPNRRGSHANRVKAAQTRLAALNRGLEDLGTEPMQIDMALLKVPAFKLKQTVVMPSGTLARFLGLLPQDNQLLATVMCRKEGNNMLLQVDPAALRPYTARHMSSV